MYNIWMPRATCRRIEYLWNEIENVIENFQNIDDYSNDYIIEYTHGYILACLNLPYRHRGLIINSIFRMEKQLWKIK